MEVADALCAPVVRQRTHRFLQRVLTDSNTFLMADHMLWFTRDMQLYSNRHDKSWSLQIASVSQAWLREVSQMVLQETIILFEPGFEIFYYHLAALQAMGHADD